MPVVPRIEIINQTEHRVGLRKTALYLNAALRLLRRSHRIHSHKLELVVVIVSRAEIQRLNKKYRLKNRPTDILSFESDLSLGELIVCYDVIREYARKHHVRIQDEITYVLLHGILHLLGYDHETSKQDEARMFRLQDRLYNRLAKNFNLKPVQKI